MKSKKIIVYASLATILLSGSKLTVEANSKVVESDTKIEHETLIEDYISHPEKYEVLTVENTTYEQDLEYSRQGYVLVGRSETSSQFIREKEFNYDTLEDAVSDYINNPNNYEVLTVENTTYEQDLEYSRQGYVLVGRSETSSQFIRKININYVEKNNIVNDFVNNPDNYELLTVNDVAIEKAKEYSYQGYELISRSETSMIFVRKKANVFKRIETNATLEEIDELTKEGYKLVAGTEDEFNNKLYYFEKLSDNLKISENEYYATGDYVNFRNQFETLVFDNMDNLEFQKYANEGFMPIDLSENQTILIRRRNEYEQNIIVNPSNDEIEELQDTYTFVAGSEDEYGNKTYVYEKKLTRK